MEVSDSESSESLTSLQTFQLAAPLLLITVITFLISQCSKKKADPVESTRTLREPSYPSPQPKPKPGEVPTEEMYIYWNSPYKRKPEDKPTQDKIAEMLAIHDAAKDPETRRKWGEEYCSKNQMADGPKLPEVCKVGENSRASAKRQRSQVGEVADEKKE